MRYTHTHTHINICTLWTTLKFIELTRIHPWFSSSSRRTSRTLRRSSSQTFSTLNLHPYRASACQFEFRSNVYAQRRNVFSKHELRQIFRSNISFYRTRKFSQLRNWIKNHDVPTFRVESDKKGILFLKRKNRGSIVSRITWRHSHCCPSRLKVSLIDDTRDRLAAVLQDNDRLLSYPYYAMAAHRGVGKALERRPRPSVPPPLVLGRQPHE